MSWCVFRALPEENLGEGEDVADNSSDCHNCTTELDCLSNKIVLVG